MISGFLVLFMTIGAFLVLLVLMEDVMDFVCIDIGLSLVAMGFSMISAGSRACSMM